MGSFEEEKAFLDGPIEKPKTCVRPRRFYADGNGACLLFVL